MSEQVEPTSGPWTTQHINGPIIEIISGPRLLADVYWTEDSKSSESYVSEAEGVANARIMAAGRELLAALKGCVESLQYVNDKHPEATGWGVRGERIEKALAAIAAATGGTPS